MNKKRCTKCERLLPLTEFHKMRDGVHSYCRDCVALYQKCYYIHNKKRIKERQEEYYSKHGDKRIINQRKYDRANKEKKRQYCEINKERICQNRHKYYEKNKEKFKKSAKEYYGLHKKRLNGMNNVRQQHLKKTNPKIRLCDNISSYIYSRLRRNKNGRHWEDIVGYTIEALREHLEKQFVGGMTWDNYGEWHIDHILPISSFNYETPDDDEFKQCWGLTNLQPLWAIDNLRKGSSLFQRHDKENEDGAETIK